MKFAYQIIVPLLVCATCCAEPSITRITHQAEMRVDGGYTLTLTGTERHLLPITAEGMFPKSQTNHKIVLKGKGKDWSYRNQPGYFYSFPEDIEASAISWDVGYVWVDKNRETIYLNFYWIKSPDALTASKINGAYKIAPIH